MIGDVVATLVRELVTFHEEARLDPLVIGDVVATTTTFFLLAVTLATVSIPS